MYIARHTKLDCAIGTSICEYPIIFSLLLLLNVPWHAVSSEIVYCHKPATDAIRAHRNCSTSDVSKPSAKFDAASPSHATMADLVTVFHPVAEDVTRLLHETGSPLNPGRMRAELHLGYFHVWRMPILYADGCVAIYISHISSKQSRVLSGVHYTYVVAYYIPGRCAITDAIVHSACIAVCIGYALEVRR